MRFGEMPLLRAFNGIVGQRTVQCEDEKANARVFGL